jgi:hypothetical protein
LVLRCELSDEVKAGAIADFLNLEEFTIVRSNRTSDKPYAYQYDEFRRRIRLPATLLDELYESKFAKHFYSDEERRQWRTRWLTGSGPGVCPSPGQR